MNYLILSVTAGEGHNSTAKAMKNELEQMGAEAQILDTFDYISPEVAKMLNDGYLLVTEKAKGAYRIGYSIAENIKTKSTPLPLFNRVMANEIAKYINATAYDAVIFTHPFAGILTDVLKERHIIHTKTLGILTDFAFHPFWEDCVHNDYVVIPDRSLMMQARAKGFADRQVLPYGIPINPKFSTRQPKEDARRALGLDPDKPVLLLMGGSMGYGNMREVVEKIDSLGDLDFSLVTVCGRNGTMKAEIDEYAKNAAHPMLVTGFIDYVETVMDASDGIITKPGGLTTSEALAKGLPMIISNPIPGQEERNTEFLLNAGCAMLSSKTCPVEECIYRLLSSPERLEAMRLSIASVGKPNSTKDVCSFLLSLPSEHDYVGLAAEAPEEPDDIVFDGDGHIFRNHTEKEPE